MIDVHTATPEQIRHAGIEILARELGVVGMIRFLQQFDPGIGDYTRDRDQWLGPPQTRRAVRDAWQPWQDLEHREVQEAREFRWDLGIQEFPDPDLLLLCQRPAYDTRLWRTEEEGQARATGHRTRGRLQTVL